VTWQFTKWSWNAFKTLANQGWIRAPNRWWEK
jgi:hypothetical protein